MLELDVDTPTRLTEIFFAVLGMPVIDTDVPEVVATGVPRVNPPVPALTAVTKPLALTVTFALLNVPTFEFTVASVPAPVTPDVPLNAALVYEISPVMEIV